MYNDKWLHLQVMFVARDWHGLHAALSSVSDDGNPVLAAYRLYTARHLVDSRIQAAVDCLNKVVNVGVTAHGFPLSHSPLTHAEIGFIGLALVDNRLHLGIMSARKGLNMASKAYKELGSTEGSLRTQFLDACMQYESGSIEASDALAAIVEKSRLVDASLYFACMQNLAVVECTQGRTHEALRRLLTMVGELEALLLGHGTPPVTPRTVVFAHDGPHSVPFDVRKHLLAAYGQLAILLAEKGAVDQATEYYRKGLDMLRQGSQPQELATWCNNLAVLRMDADDAHGAEELLREATQCLDPENASHTSLAHAASFSLARCYFMQQQYRQALDLLTNLFGSNPHPMLIADCYILQAEVLSDCGRAAEGIPIAQRALDTLRDSGQTIRILRAQAALAYAQSCQGQASWIPALATVAAEMEAANLIPDAVRTYRTLARVSQHAGDVQGALDALRLSTDRVGVLQQQTANDRSQVLSTLFQVELVRSRALQAETAAQVERLQHEKTSDVLHQVNEALLSHKAELASFRTEVANIVAGPGDADEKLAKLKRKLRDAPNMRDSWNHYVDVFSKAHPRFLRSLSERCTMLTGMEVRVCVLTRAGMTSEEIADVLCLSARTIETHRQNIRKKFGLTGRTSLSALLSTL
jgi:DNA-binding CsgD family transcriptional regulator